MLFRLRNLKVAVAQNDYRYVSSFVINRQQSKKASIDPAYFYQPGEQPIMDSTMGQLLESVAKEYPKQDGLISLFQGVKLNFSEILTRADRLAAGFRKIGLKPGDRIGIWSPNRYEWNLTYAASTRLGIILAGINPWYTQREIDFCLQKIRVNAVVAPASYRHQNYAEMLLKAKICCPSLEHIVIFEDDHVTGTRRLRDIETMAGKKEIEAIKEEQTMISPYTATNIQFTSGTTGNPKAVVLSHRSLVNNSKQLTTRMELKNRKICLNVPCFHAFGMLMGIAVPWHVGATIVLESPTFNPVKSINAIVKEKCSVTCGTPTMWINMVDVQNKSGADVNSLYTGIIGGASASPNLYQNIEKYLKFDKIVNIYGLTESNAMISQSLPGESKILRETTVGHVSDHLEVKIIDENGEIVPFGASGELCIRGYNTMMKYWEDEEKTREILSDDKWLRTGDKLVLDTNGYLTLIGRLKDMLIRGGENIYPREIESFYETHPKIAEVHVIGVYDEVYGEEVCAFIRPRHDEKLSKEDILNYAKGKLAHFKIPRYVQFCEDFPKTGSGKIQKHKLRQEAEDQNFVPRKPKM